MNPRTLTAALFWTASVLSSASAQEKILPQEWDYAPAMKKVAAKFRGKPGVVLHVGDSITYSNPYSQWARGGAGKTDADKAILKWMHAGADNDTDGWYLCRFDHPAGGRSYTACSGIRAEEMLAGGKQQMPPLSKIIEPYKPQMVILMLGTNDASANRPVAAFRKDMTKAVDTILDQGAICILSTIPPHPGKMELAKAYNEALRQLAKDRGLPLIDYEKEILTRRPSDWNGTLLGKNDVHPTGGKPDGVNAASAPIAENLRNSGYLLRGWLSVQKVAEVKKKVLDGLPEPKSDNVPPAPKGEPVRVAVTRDTWLSQFKGEDDGSNGGATQLKLKSNVEMSLIDIDPAALRGRVIEAATLHVRSTGKPHLLRVTVGSFGSEWYEGTSSSYKPQKGSSSFRRKRHPDEFWTVPGSDLCSVMLGQGGTLWRMADATPPDAKGWQRIPVDPAVTAARVAGISYGFLLFDDTGSEWTRQGEKFTQEIFPNRFIYSRESGAASAPYLTVYLGAEDKSPPAVPAGITAEIQGLPAGEARVSWIAPKDDGPAGTIGFFVTVDGKEVPRYLIPLAGNSGENVSMHLRDLKLKPGAEVSFAVRAVDRAGNISIPAEARIRLSDRRPNALPGTFPKPFTEAGPLPTLGNTEVSIIDELDKAHPVSGAMIPPQPEGYLAANHLWNAKEKQLRLHAARNEFVGFQILLRGPASNVQPSLTFEGKDSAGIQVAFGSYRHVDSKTGPLPDPIVPLGDSEKIEGQKSASLYCEVYVSHEAAPGKRRGTLRLKAGDQTLDLAVSLEVWNFTLPDYLSFLPEMNCYGLPRNERDYYRLAHRHRTVLNRVPYSQAGNVHDGCAPHWNGKTLAWSAWDRRFGPYFDGSAFADLPRKGVPLECFYLPIHENWPTPIDPNYNGDYWADRAFTPPYRQALVDVSRLMAEHMNARAWNDTFFQFFLNGKNNFKEAGWSRGSSPWLLDEPSNFQDYWALRYFGIAYHEGVAKAPGKAKMVYRCDISRPQWQRDSLDGLLDVNVVGGAVRHYARMVADRKEANGEVAIEYGGSNAIEMSNLQPAGWCVDVWTKGNDGVLPWQTVGTAASWKKADVLSLFYPGRTAVEGPLPSIRLKSYRRGQQDVEYLTLLMQLKNEPRWAIGQKVREELHLSGERGVGDPKAVEDAGVIHFSRLKPQDLWALRVRIGQLLSDLKPAAKRRLVELRTPPRDVSKLTSRYVSGGKQSSATKPSDPADSEIEKVLQGREVVRDALIDPTQPEKKLGSEGRGNAIKKAKEVCAFLVRFDVDQLKLPLKTRVAKATVSFYVWDPSSAGNTKVCAFGLKTPWEEATVTWRQPAADKKWKGDKSFALGTDAGEAAPAVVVKPDMGSDTVDPPLEYQLDVTELVQAWLDGKAPNYGLAIAPVPDRSVDEGNFTRFQVYGSEHGQVKYTPKLTVSVKK